MAANTGKLGGVLMNAANKAASKINIDYGAVTVTASLSAILRVTANTEPIGDYPLFGYGNFFSQVYNIENKENTVAKNVKLISVIPILLKAHQA